MFLTFILGFQFLNLDINLFEQGLESFFLSKDELVVAVCTVKYLEVGIIHPGDKCQ